MGNGESNGGGLLDVVDEADERIEEPHVVRVWKQIKIQLKRALLSPSARTVVHISVGKMFLGSGPRAVSALLIGQRGK